MKAFFKNRLNRFALRISRVSFCIGHVLFLLYLSFPMTALFSFGMVFLVLFITVHVLLLSTLFLHTLVHYRDLEENLVALLIAFLNVPLAFLYLTLL